MLEEHIFVIIIYNIHVIVSMLAVKALYFYVCSSIILHMYQFGLSLTVYRNFYGIERGGKVKP